MAGPAGAHHTPQNSIGFNLAAILIVMGLLGLGVAYLIDAAGRASRTQAHRLDTETTLTRTLGGSDLEIPLSWFRYEEQRVEGFAKQIDRFHQPGFRPRWRHHQHSRRSIGVLQVAHR